MEMIPTTNMNLGDYLRKIEDTYGSYYPDRDGVEVSSSGEELLFQLSQLEKYQVGNTIEIGSSAEKIKELITVDGRKMVFEDGYWLMVRPSGTEPKVRFYVETRTADGTAELVETAKSMLKEIGIL